MWCGEKMFTTLSALQDNFFRICGLLVNNWQEPTTGKNATKQKNIDRLSGSQTALNSIYLVCPKWISEKNFL